MGTYSCKNWKKLEKLKSCRVGCVLFVRFGNVDKNAWAISEHAKSWFNCISLTEKCKYKLGIVRNTSNQRRDENSL